jgi:cytochrome c-type biogenesis protein CcmH
MTSFVLATLLLTTLTAGWLTRPLWHRAAPVGRFDETPMPAPPRPVALIGVMCAFVALIVGIGYAAVGTPEQLQGSELRGAQTPPPSVRREAVQAPIDDALVQAEARVTKMIEKLSDRLKANPNDADGWHTLARSQAALGRHAQAIDAFTRAARLHPDEPSLLAEYAYSSAVLDPHAASGEASRLIGRALQIDPANPKALALAGTLALDRKDYPAAISHWERLARIEPAETPTGKQLQFSILQAKQLAGLRGGATNVAAGDAADASLMKRR